MKKLYKTIIERLKKESPTIFKNIGRLGIGLIILGTGLLTSDMVGFIPEPYKIIAGHLIAIGTTAKFVASLTVKDTIPPKVE